MSSSETTEESGKRLPTVTEASVAAMVRLRSRFGVLKELIDMYEDIDSNCKGRISREHQSELNPIPDHFRHRSRRLDFPEPLLPQRNLRGNDLPSPAGPRDRRRLRSRLRSPRPPRPHHSRQQRQHRPPRRLWNHFEVLNQHDSRSAWEAVGSSTIGALDTRSAAEEVAQERHDIVAGLARAGFEMEAFEVGSEREVGRIAKQSRKVANEALVGKLKKAMKGWEKESEVAVGWMKEALLEDSRGFRSAT